MLGEFLQAPFCRYMPWRQWLGWAGQTSCRIKLVGLGLTLDWSQFLGQEYQAVDEFSQVVNCQS